MSANNQDPEESMETPSNNIITPRTITHTRHVFNIRDHLYYNLSLLYMLLFPRPVRRLIEFVVLYMAVYSFFALTYIHFNFTSHTANCLDHVIDIWPKNGVLRLEIIQSYPHYDEQPAIINKYLAAEQSYTREYRLENVLYKSNKNWSVFKDFTKSNYSANIDEVDIEPPIVELVENKCQTIRLIPTLFDWLFTNNINIEDKITNMLISSSKKNYKTPSKSNVSLSEMDFQSAQFYSTEFSKSSTLHVLEVNSSLLHQSASTTLPPIENHNGTFYENYIVEYSLNNEYLSLSSDARNRLGIPVMLVTLDPTWNKCFGISASHFILENFIGYDEVLMSSIRAVSQLEGCKGFLRNVLTGEYYKFAMNRWSDKTDYITSFLYMIIITFFISLFVKYTCRHIRVSFRFLFSRARVNYIRMLKLYITILAFFGLGTILLLYFNNLKVLCCVIMIVVVAESYYAVFSYSAATKKHWQKFFFLYLFFFYAYDYRFGGQYRILVLTCTSLFMQHSMIFFYHHFELPHVEEQDRLMESMIQRQQEQMRVPQYRPAGRDLLQTEG